MTAEQILRALARRWAEAGRPAVARRLEDHAASCSHAANILEATRRALDLVGDIPPALSATPTYAEVRDAEAAGLAKLACLLRQGVLS
jgi:hypothetical protein